MSCHWADTRTQHVPCPTCLELSRAQANCSALQQVASVCWLVPRVLLAELQEAPHDSGLAVARCITRGFRRPRKAFLQQQFHHILITTGCSRL
jgi:hypothetical protein